MSRILVEQRNDFLPSDIDKQHLASLVLEGGEGSENIMDFIVYAERRFTFTLLTSRGYLNGGAATMGYLPTEIGESATVSTKIPTIQDGTRDKAEVKYKIMGRNRRAVAVIGSAAFGTATAASQTSGGFFTVGLATKEVNPTQVVEFPTGKTARVHGEPRRNPSGPGYLYTFQTFAGETFTWETYMGYGTSNKTVYASHNTVGERSRKGYMSWLLPDTYINHASTMRKGFGMSGDALVEAGCRKYSLNNGNGTFEGYAWTSEAMMREQFNQDMDNWAWEGKSTMRDQFGNLLTSPSQVDEKGDPIYAGDGVKEQIRGSNDVVASGTDGLPTWQDYEDLFLTARDRRDPGEMGEQVFVTGPKGSDNLLDKYLAYNRARYGTTVQAQVNNNKFDVPYLHVDTVRVGGETIYVVVDPRMGDKQRYGSSRLANGIVYKEYEGYLLDFGQKNGRQNVAMETLDNKFVNREYVIGKFDGMTGLKGSKPTSPTDEFSMEVLSQRIVTVRDPKNCGLLEINPSNIMY
jgi:hypothetical protein